jgi:hypothetical protein
MVPIYVFPEIKLFYTKQNYNVLSTSSSAHIFVGDLYISRIGLPILLQGSMWTDPEIWNLGLRPRNSQKKNTYINEIFLAVRWTLPLRNKRGNPPKMVKTKEILG